MITDYFYIATVQTRAVHLLGSVAKPALWLYKETGWEAKKETGARS